MYCFLYLEIIPYYKITGDYVVYSRVIKILEVYFIRVLDLPNFQFVLFTWDT